MLGSVQKPKPPECCEVTATTARRNPKEPSGAAGPDYSGLGWAMLDYLQVQALGHTQQVAIVAGSSAAAGVSANTHRGKIA